MVKKTALVQKKKRETNFDEPRKTSSCDECGSIKLEIQIGPASQSLKINVSLGQDVKTVSDVVDKVKQLVPELRDVEDIQVYQDECLLTLGEKVDVINTQEVVVIIPRVKTEYFEEDVSRKKRPIKAEAEGGAPKKARVSNLHHPKTSWQNLPDVVFSEVMIMAGLENLHDLHKCRQICQSWNVMTYQMTKHEKDTVRINAESLAAYIRDQIIFPAKHKVCLAASLAHHGMLGSLKYICLVNVDLASVPPENLASLASLTSPASFVNLSNVSNCDLVSILDSVKCKPLKISNKSLSGEETRALVRAMESRVEAVALGMRGDLSLDITALTQYSGQGKCWWVQHWGDTTDRYGEELRSWARRINWNVTTVGNNKIKIERKSNN